MVNAGGHASTLQCREPADSRMVIVSHLATELLQVKCTRMASGGKAPDLLHACRDGVSCMHVTPLAGRCSGNANLHLPLEILLLYAVILSCL